MSHLAQTIGHELVKLLEEEITSTRLKVKSGSSKQTECELPYHEHLHHELKSTKEKIDQLQQEHDLLLECTRYAKYSLDHTLKQNEELIQKRGQLVKNLQALEKCGGTDFSIYSDYGRILQENDELRQQLQKLRGEIREHMDEHASTSADWTVLDEREYLKRQLDSWRATMSNKEKAVIDVIRKISQNVMVSSTVINENKLDRNMAAINIIKRKSQKVRDVVDTAIGVDTANTANDSCKVGKTKRPVPDNGKKSGNARAEGAKKRKHNNFS